MKDGRRRKEEISITGASSGIFLRGAIAVGRWERNKKRKGKSGRVWFLLASRYQAEGRHMKLANVPTCPFPTYRVFPASCSRVESEKRTACRDWSRWETRGNPSSGRRVGGGLREGGGNTRRGFLLISRTWLKLVRHKNQVSSLPGIRYRYRSLLPLLLSLASLHLRREPDGVFGRDRSAWISVKLLVVNLNQVLIRREWFCLYIKSNIVSKI